MKVLVLATFPSTAACTRYRCALFFDYLKSHGIECELRPFLGKAAFRNLYRRGGWLSKVGQVLKAALLRAREVFAVSGFDVVFVQREAMLFGPPVVEWWCARVLRKPLVFDFDDAIFVPYTSPTYGRLATWLKWPGKTATLLRWATSVIAGNNYLADYARQFNGEVTIIPTVVEATNWATKSKGSSPHSSIVVGWIGSPTTTRYLLSVLPVLERLATRHRFVLRVVGANEPICVPGLEVENVAWQQSTEVEQFQSLDVGLYPIVEDRWSVGKSGFKAIQYLAAGVPCVASPVGVNREIIKHDTNGLLAATPAEWEQQLERLLTDAELRQRLAAAGRCTVAERYSLEVHAPRLLAVLQAAKGSRA